MADKSKNSILFKSISTENYSTELLVLNIV